MLGYMAGVIHICYGVTQTIIPPPPYAPTHLPIPQQLSQHITSRSSQLLRAYSLRIFDDTFSGEIVSGGFRGDIYEDISSENLLYLYLGPPLSLQESPSPSNKIPLSEYLSRNISL